MKKILQVFVMSALFLYCLWVFVDLVSQNKGVLESLQQDLMTLTPVLAGCFLAFALSMVIRSHRWIKLLNNQHSFGLSFRSIAIGYLVQCPLSKLGEVARVGNYKKNSSTSLPTLLSTIFIDRLLDMFALISIIIYCLFISSDLIETNFPQFSSILPKLGAFLLVATLGSIFLLVFKSKLELFVEKQSYLPEKSKHFILNFLSKFTEGFQHSKSKSDILYLILSTIFIWFLYFIAFFLVVYFYPHIPNDITLNEVWLLFCIATIGVLIPVPGGMAYPLFMQKGMEVIWPEVSSVHVISLATITYLFNFWAVNILIGGGSILYQLIQPKTEELA